MEKFMEELKKAKNPWVKRIGNYLLSRDDMKENLKKESKSLKECFDYILIELSKKCVKDSGVGYVAGDDKEIYALAVHYYDENDIQVGNKNFTTNADGSANQKRLAGSNSKQHVQKPKEVIKEVVKIDQKAIDEAVSKALESYKQEEKEKEKKKKEETKRKREELKAKKEAEKKQGNDCQLNLFELLGDENE